jgi:hypothetical protein
MTEPGWHAGKFVWRELTTDDVDGARRFYSGLSSRGFVGSVLARVLPP